MSVHDPAVNTDLLKALHRICTQYCQEEGGSHGPDHSERVFQLSMFMGRKLDASLDIIAPAALLHDIGRKQESRTKGNICHAEQGAEMAEPLLLDLRYSATDRAAVCHCIRSHRFRTSIAPASLEAKIIFDADKLDSIGAIGIGRAFLFAGQIGARLHNAEIDPARTDSYTTEDTAYREFQVKMSKVRDQMLTPIGRRFARRRHEFMETFFAELNREVYGSELL